MGVRRAGRADARARTDAVPVRKLLSAEPDADRLLEGMLATVQCTVYRAGWFPTPPGWLLPRRSLPVHVLWACVHGAAYVSVGGRDYHLRAGGLLLAPPHVQHEGRADPASDPLKVFVLHFTARAYGVVDAPALYHLPVLSQPVPVHHAQIVEVLTRIIRELAGTASGYLLTVNCLCGWVFALLWRDVVAQGLRPDRVSASLPGAAAVARLAPVFRLVQARYGEHLSVAEMASAAHVHPNYLSTLFRQATGHSPMRYLARYRIDRVRELLRATDLSVAEIAFQTGFRDPFYLSRAFRRVVGVSPREYRLAEKSPALP